MRFNIPLSQLPANSQLINEPDTFLYKYKHIVLVGIITFIVLLALLLLLSFILYKKKRRNKLYRTHKSDFINNDKEENSRASLQKVIDIQISMTPQHFHSFAQTNHIDLSAYLQPGMSPRVDFYDFFSMDDNFSLSN